VKGFHRGMSVRLHTMIDNFFGYFGALIGSSIGGVMGYKYLTNSTRKFMQNHSYLKNVNYRFRYLVVVPATLFCCVIFSGAGHSIFPFIMKCYFKAFYFSKFVSQGVLEDLEDRTKLIPQLREEVFEEVQRRIDWEKQLYRKINRNNNNRNSKQSEEPNPNNNNDK